MVTESQNHKDIKNRSFYVQHMGIFVKLKISNFFLINNLRSGQKVTLIMVLSIWMEEKF